MIISSPFYIGLEELKSFLDVKTDTKNDRYKLLVAAISRFIENHTGRKFYPTTEARYFDWESPREVIFRRDDLLSVSALHDGSADKVVDISYLLYEEKNYPPYRKIILEPTMDSFFYDNYKEQSIKITGDWGYCDTVVDTGITCPDLSSGATSMAVSNGSKIDIGWLLLIDSERIFVQDISESDSGEDTSGSVEDYTIDIPVGTPSAFHVGEILRINDENMKVKRINASSVSVERAYDGTTPVSHSSGVDVYVYRTFTIEGAQHGSTPASHTIGATISRYVPPADIVIACGILVSRADKRSDSSWSDTLGSSEIGTLIFSKAMPIEVASVLSGYVRDFVGDI